MANNKEEKSLLAGKSKDEIIQIIEEGMLYLTDSDLDADRGLPALGEKWFGCG